METNLDNKRLKQTKSLREDKKLLISEITQVSVPIFKKINTKPFFASETYCVTLLPNVKFVMKNESICLWLKFDSDISFITRRTVTTLNLKIKIDPDDKREYVDVKIPIDTKSISDRFFVIDRITKHPTYGFLYYANDEFFHDISGNLANRDFNEPSEIDIILNGGSSFQCLRSGQRMHSQGTFSAKNTIFGWVIAGDAYIKVKTDDGMKFLYLIKPPNN